MNVTGAGNTAPVESKFDLGAKLVKQANEGDQQIADIVAKAAETTNESRGSATAPGVGAKIDVSV
ncbi:hypothetical protein [Breoghania sp. L-A4]|uniref:hypothetical protein n=1 Tax=Breoghania sp. L-A4 TaxID=2304600 RepID=UPI000E3602B8|nr:hypothetical protein [Breoghania sp. L-A4]AXS38744.1 hypothetical protein D1F64_00070 [Breoghania sp. L-A4]